MHDDIYLYTGVTSVIADESNLGFILTNMRTKETHYYNIPGAEEFSAMASSEGAEQDKKYKATFTNDYGGVMFFCIPDEDSARIIGYENR